MGSSCIFCFTALLRFSAFVNESYVSVVLSLEIFFTQLRVVILFVTSTSCFPLKYYVLIATTWNLLCAFFCYFLFENEIFAVPFFYPQTFFRFNKMGKTFEGLVLFFSVYLNILTFYSF